MIVKASTSREVLSARPACGLYALEIPSLGICKVGCSLNVIQRLFKGHAKTWAVETWGKVWLSQPHTNISETEAMLLRRLGACRGRGEVFQQDVEYIAMMAEGLPYRMDAAILEKAKQKMARFVEQWPTLAISKDVHRALRVAVAKAGGKIGDYVDSLIRKSLGLPLPRK